MTAIDTAVGTSSTEDYLSTLTSSNSQAAGGEVYEMMATHMVHSLKLARDTVETLLDGMGNAERTRAQQAIEQMNKYIEQLEQQKNLSGLQKFLKALGPLGLVIAAIMAVMAPSPMTIALLVVAVVMVLEPMISQAAGADSVIEQGMSEIFKGLESALGPVGAAVVSAMIFLVIVVVATSAMSAGFSMMTSTMTTGLTQTLVQQIRNLPAMIQQMFGSGLTPSQSQQLQIFLEVAQSALLVGQGSLQMNAALINYNIAELMREFNMDQVTIDAWTRTIERVSSDMNQEQNLVHFLQNFIPRLFDEGQP